MVDVVWCCLDDRRWKQCRNQNRLALLLWLRTLLGTKRVPYMLVDVVLILHASLTTKITVALFTIISTYSPWRQKNREARSTALQPIRLITRRVVLGRDCMLFEHAILGCDTTSRVLNIGKRLALKHIRSDNHFITQAGIFLQWHIKRRRSSPSMPVHSCSGWHTR